MERILELVSRCARWLRPRRSQHIYTIHPYKWHNIWVFTDPRAGLFREMLVQGVPELIEHATAHLPDPESGFTARFSDVPFPTQGPPTVLRLSEPLEDGSAWYVWQSMGSVGQCWLCPNLLRYYTAQPETIYVEIT